MARGPSRLGLGSSAMLCALALQALQPGAAYAQKGAGAGQASAAGQAASSSQGTGQAGGSALGGESFGFDAAELRQRWRSPPVNLERTAARFVCFEVREDKDPKVYEQRTFGHSLSGSPPSLYADYPLYAVPINHGDITDENGFSFSCLDRKLAYQQPLKMGDRLVVVLKMDNRIARKLSRITVNVQSQPVAPIVLNPIRQAIDSGTAVNAEEDPSDTIQSHIQGWRQTDPAKELEWIERTREKLLHPSPTSSSVEDQDLEKQIQSDIGSIADGVKAGAENRVDRRELNDLSRSYAELVGPRQNVDPKVELLLLDLQKYEISLRRELKGDTAAAKRSEKAPDAKTEAGKETTAGLWAQADAVQGKLTGLLKPRGQAEELEPDRWSYYYLEVQTRLSGDTAPTLTVAAEYEQTDVVSVDANKQLQCIGAQPAQSAASAPAQLSVGSCLAYTPYVVGSVTQGDKHVTGLSTDVRLIGWTKNMPVVAYSGGGGSGGASAPGLPSGVVITDIDPDGKGVTLSDAAPSPAAAAPADGAPPAKAPEPQTYAIALVAPTAPLSQAGLTPLSYPAKSDVTFIQDALPQVHALSSFNVAAGVVYNTVKSPTYGYVGSGSSYIAKVTGSSAIYDPVLFLMWYPLAVDAESPTQCWRTLFPFGAPRGNSYLDYPRQCLDETALSIGFSMASPSSNFYVGPTIEPIRGVQLMGGFTFTKISTLPALNAATNTCTVPTTGSNPCTAVPVTIQRFHTGAYAGITIDLKSFISALSGWGSSTASGGAKSSGGS